MQQLSFYPLYRVTKKTYQFSSLKPIVEMQEKALWKFSVEWKPVPLQQNRYI